MDGAARPDQRRDDDRPARPIPPPDAPVIADRLPRDGEPVGHTLAIDDLDDRWPELEGPAPAPTARRRWWVIAALVPWAVAAVALLPRGGPSATDEVTGSATDEITGLASAVASTAGSRDATAAAPGIGPDVQGQPGRPEPTFVATSLARRDHGVGSVMALATVVARGWLTSVGPRLEGIEPATSHLYVEHLAVEAIDAPDAGHVVVTVLATVLDVEADAYTSARAVRLAVPVAMTPDGPAPAGQPWWLPPPGLTPAQPDWGSPVEDEALLSQAAQALAAAGYRDVESVALRRSAGWPGLVEFDGRAPGADHVAPHAAWVRPHLGALVVAGWLPEDPRGDR